MGHAPVRGRQCQAGMEPEGDVFESREMSKQIVLQKERGDRSRWGARFVISRPSTSTLPARGLSNPAIRDSSVLLAAPLAPMSAGSSPARFHPPCWTLTLSSSGPAGDTAEAVDDNKDGKAHDHKKECDHRRLIHTVTAQCPVEQQRKRCLAPGSKQGDGGEVACGQRTQHQRAFKPDNPAQSCKTRTGTPPIMMDCGAAQDRRDNRNTQGTQTSPLTRAASGRARSNTRT